MRLLSLFVVVVALVLGGAACGGRTPKAEVDAKALLLRGHFSAARAAVTLTAGSSAEDRAIVALSLILEAPVPPSATLAIDALVQGSSRSDAAVAGTTMLSLLGLLPTAITLEASMLVVEAAMGAGGYGPLAGLSLVQVKDGLQARALAVAASERVSLALTASPSEPVSTARLVAIWNGCYSLLGGELVVLTDVEAWRLYCSLAGLAIAVSNAEPDSELTAALLGSAIAVIEAKQSLAVPARCDLASPFDSLRAAVAYDLTLLTRLESSVAAATGCTRGMYAPTATSP